MWFKCCKFRQYRLLSTANYKSRFCSCQNYIDILRDKSLTTSTLLSQEVKSQIVIVIIWTCTPTGSEFRQSRWVVNSKKCSRKCRIMMISIGKKTQSGCLLALNFPNVWRNFPIFMVELWNVQEPPISQNWSQNFVQLVGKKKCCRLISLITFSGGVKSLEVSKGMILELLNASPARKNI